MKTIRDNTQPSFDLAEHVCLLEKQLRRQKQFLWLTALLLVSVAAIGAARQDADVIRVKSLKIVDDAGVVLGEFSSGANGGTFLVANAQGRAAVRIEVDHYGGVLQTFHPDGRKGVAIRQYPIAATQPPLTGGMVEVFDYQEESVVVLGSGVDRGVSVSMGAGYDGGAVVVFRKGVPIHLARPQEARPEQSLPLTLNGMRFISIGRYETGLGPNGPVPGYWHVAFGEGSATWYYSDVRETGSFTVSEDGTIKAKMGPNGLIEGFIDRTNNRLFWDGKWYRLDDPAKVPE